MVEGARIPLAVAWAAIDEVTKKSANQPDWVLPLLSAGLLALALALAAERYRWPAAWHWLALGGTLALLAGWYALVPELPDLVWSLRLAVLLLGLHLAVAAASYLGELRRGAGTPGFWPWGVWRVRYRVKPGRTVQMQLLSWSATNRVPWASSTSPTGRLNSAWAAGPSR